MTEHRVGTQEEFDAAREKLLAEEKELTRRNDELAQKRRDLPWVAVEKEYSFETVDGAKSLTDLFAGRSQLLIYHFMFGPPYDAGCTVCSSITDTITPNVVHLAARDVTMVLVSRAPLERLQAYRKRMGWNIEWVSAGGSGLQSRPRLHQHRGGAATLPRGRDSPRREAHGRAFWDRRCSATSRRHRG